MGLQAWGVRLTHRGARALISQPHSFYTAPGIRRSDAGTLAGQTVFITREAEQEAYEQQEKEGGGRDGGGGEEKEKWCSWKGT